MKQGKAASEGKRRERPHPYQAETSSPLEEKVGNAPAILVLAISGVVAAVGVYLQSQYGYINNAHASPGWETWTRVPLFAGLGLLALGLLRHKRAPLLSMIGWALFGAYWALTARDLLVKEGQDYVNFVFALAGVFLCGWLVYHRWLDSVRGVTDAGARFLQIATTIAAGSYFLIDKIEPVRVGLITIVSRHTEQMLSLFGQGKEKGLVFLTDHADSKSPTTFFYPEIYCDTYPGRPADAVSDYCAAQGIPRTINYANELNPPTNWFEQILMYTPEGESLRIVPVSIILACTAIQSIMLFVGLFMGTRAPMRKKVYASIAIGLLVYILNLVRNTGIIWFYGQGFSSFWTMHNAIGKGGSLIAMILIAVWMFRWFPEFLQSLIGVLDMVDRDGPLERTLRLGRPRPEAVGTTPVDTDGALGAGAIASGQIVAATQFVDSEE